MEPGFVYYKQQGFRVSEFTKDTKRTYVVSLLENQTERLTVTGPSLQELVDDFVTSINTYRLEHENIARTILDDMTHYMQRMMDLSFVEKLRKGVDEYIDRKEFYIGPAREPRPNEIIRHDALNDILVKLEPDTSLVHFYASILYPGFPPITYHRILPKDKWIDRLPGTALAVPDEASRRLLKYLGKLTTLIEQHTDIVKAYAKDVTGHNARYSLQRKIAQKAMKVLQDLKTCISPNGLDWTTWQKQTSDFMTEMDDLQKQLDTLKSKIQK